MTRRGHDRREAIPRGGGAEHERQPGAAGAGAPRWRRGGAPPLREDGARRRNCRTAEARMVSWEWNRVTAPPFFGLKSNHISFLISWVCLLEFFLLLIAPFCLLSNSKLNNCLNYLKKK